MKLSFLTCSCCTFESSPGLMKTSLTCCSVYCTYIWSTSCCVVVNYVLKGSLTYLCNRNCPPCTWRDQSHQVSHNQWKTPTHSWQQCPCGKHTFILVHYDQSFCACEDLQTAVVMVMLTGARSVCSPGMPALCSAGRRTESAWTGPGCTSLLAKTTSTKNKHNGDYQMVFRWV